MANISPYTDAIRNAIYGEEVRGSIADAIDAMNVESSGAYSAAISSQTSASASAQAAQTDAAKAKSFAIGPNGSASSGTDTNNAYYWYQQAYAIAQSLAGGLIPMGTITFANLPTTGMEVGYMYNVSDEFTTDDRFKEGAGIVVGGGSNVYYTNDGYWDILPGATVVGIKGAAESVYRKGNVSLSAADIGANLRTITFNLAVEDWVEFASNGVFVQTVEVPTLSANDIALVTAGTMTKAYRDIYAGLGLACVAHVGNSLTFEADEEPSIVIPITVVVQGGGS